MSSGVGLDDECVEKFQELKLGKKIKYIIYKLDNPSKPTKIVVGNSSESQEYDDFLEQFTDTECCYAVYDFQYNLGEGERNKICFFIWAPDTASIKQKMVYASSKDVLKRALVGLSADIQGTDASEISYEAVLDKVTRK
ncbi:cofilin [Cystobasidium minutum MCA 4210]|uniref:cofilin n=1 Tax=Cystobasidium minutum MCA 4210 TaxID=1397322 RepID=UPI0034D00866|eukprot:jgi/Rhomi1/64015/CE64014_16476